MVEKMTHGGSRRLRRVSRVGAIASTARGWWESGFQYSYGSSSSRGRVRRSRALEMTGGKRSVTRGSLGPDGAASAAEERGAPAVDFDTLAGGCRLLRLGWRVPLTPVSGTGQALSPSKGVNESRIFVAFPARMVRQAHHERGRGLQPCKASIFMVVTRAAEAQRRSPNAEPSHQRHADGDEPGIAAGRCSTRPARSRPPTATSQAKKAAPLTGCTMVAASNQMNCMAMPMMADAGDTYLKAPPAFHWRRAAITRANPATAKPILPVSHRR